MSGNGPAFTAELPDGTLINRRLSRQPTYHFPLANLVRLAIYGGIESNSYEVPLEPFLDMIPNLRRLQKLSISHSFMPLTRPNRSAHQFPRLDASSLTEVSINDHAMNVGFIMSCIILPLTAHVRLQAIVGPLRHEDYPPEEYIHVLRRMLPVNHDCLPALKEYHKLEIRREVGNCELTLSTPGLPGKLEIILFAPPLPVEPRALPEYQWLSRGVDNALIRDVRSLFPRLPATHLEFFCDVAIVSPAEWTNCLAQFPALRRLSVDDKKLENPHTTLLDALRRRPLVCPLLDHLELYGAAEAVGDLRNIRLCLEERRAGTGRRMKVFMAELHGGQRCAISPREVEDYQGLFAGLAQQSIFQFNRDGAQQAVEGRERRLGL
ncbi:hypothetical protein BC628DRAFT_1338977 [Trametes gibbosa]|nr:hypothetical protein BC628DRAFT_1338977 [Trametes gibbosa]